MRSLAPTGAHLVPVEGGAMRPGGRFDTTLASTMI
jgi:hypothetical protein